MSCRPGHKSKGKPKPKPKPKKIEKTFQKRLNFQI